MNLCNITSAKACVINNLPYSFLKLKSFHRENKLSRGKVKALPSSHGSFPCAEILLVGEQALITCKP